MVIGGGAALLLGSGPVGNAALSGAIWYGGATFFSRASQGKRGWEDLYEPTIEGAIHGAGVGFTIGLAAVLLPEEADFLLTAVTLAAIAVPVALLSAIIISTISGRSLDGDALACECVSTVRDSVGFGGFRHMLR